MKAAMVMPSKRISKALSRSAWEGFPYVVTLRIAPLARVADPGPDLNRSVAAGLAYAALRPLAHFREQPIDHSDPCSNRDDRCRQQNQTIERFIAQLHRPFDSESHIDDY